MKRHGMPMPRHAATIVTLGPLPTRDRRALAVGVVFGLLGWIAMFRLVGISLPPEPRIALGPAENPASQGTPKSIAIAAMKDSDHPCGAVLDAFRQSDGSIRAVCSNGEAYLVSDGTHAALIWRLPLPHEAQKKTRLPLNAHDAIRYSPLP